MTFVFFVVGYVNNMKRVCCYLHTLRCDLTFCGAVARNFLGHQRPLLVFAVHLYYLLPALPALGSGKSWNGFFTADLTLQLLLPHLQTRRQRRRSWLLGLVERQIRIGPLSRRCNRWQLGVGFTGVGVVAIVARHSRLDGRVLEDLVGRFSQHALRLALF